MKELKALGSIQTSNNVELKNRKLTFVVNDLFLCYFTVIKFNLIYSADGEPGLWLQGRIRLECRFWRTSRVCCQPGF
jgi:hypothetical protein